MPNLTYEKLFDYVAETKADISKCVACIERLEETIVELKDNTKKISEHVYHGNGIPPLTVRVKLLEENHEDHSKRMKKVEKYTSLKFIVFGILAWITLLVDLSYQSGFVRSVITLIGG
jgi:uncharacterized protein (UPF0335 family)